MMLWTRYFPPRERPRYRSGAIPCRGIIASFVSAVWVAVHSAAAVAQLPEPQAPTGTGPLPDFQKGAKSGVFVTREHTDKYRAILPPEVAELVDSEELAFEAALRGRQAITPPHGWSLGAPADAISLQEDGGLSQVPGLLKGFLFPPPTQSEIERDPKAAGYRILWNATAAMWGFSSFQQDLAFVLFREPKAGGRKINLSVSRIYPAAVGVTVGTLPPVFREKLVIQSPQVLEGLRWLTLRFSGDVDDYVWISSPVTGQVRQITGSNRSDALFTGALAPDDLYVWSGKVEMTQPATVRLVPLLVPVLETSWQPGEQSQEGCGTWSSKGPGLELNADTRRFPNSAPWVPTNVLFTLRNVWKIEASTKDPFSLDARQTIYVDAASNIPVYRGVWDQDGRLRKFVIGILGAAEPGVRIPAWRAQITASSTDQSRTLLIGQNMSVCGREVVGRKVEDFDPSALGPTPATGAVESAPEKSTESKVDSKERPVRR